MDARKWHRLANEELDTQVFFKAFVVKMKANEKELGPWLFHAKEKAEFVISDRTEWV